MKNDFTEFLIKLGVGLAIAAALAVPIDWAVSLFGGDISWWTAFGIAVFIVFGGVLFLSLDDWAQ
ncbi:hypothetical protein NQK81_01295 [Amycolatopsis roodepoortensis]|uniref:hypothetical protein n=1 Tax=Amycolatopsis roodepoortensis TaxID=700274 RepID=UPI00214ADC28|nr:hypothetical protein [Amycolatopsis roodepoortensis]UUV32110.1 hypothetical protein NQK81_01295 [Amycolatopsis roodepoortensis]